ncbi:membrane protein [Actinokineospora fastidiosa]|uniref:Membrane protein n=1 Tax=Actinokineospora fastidiosa TaxID=1816 RepID=A0A918GD35_9PSEU|nr:membrane protein [Actinokineospora fastidiosa]
MPGAHHPQVALVEWVIAAGAAAAVTAYLLAAARLRRRGDAWPVLRDLSFLAGGGALVWALLGHLPGGPFTAHMAQHLVVAMAAPLSLVLGRPLTLLLRVLPPRGTRRTLLAAARARPVRWLLFPPAAAVLDVGGLWLLYRTPLAASHHPLAQVHVLLAGLLFTFAICQLDPVRHRWSLAWRGLTLLGAGAAHAVLAKSLYAAPPPGAVYAATDLHTGSQLMYYGGDLVELALAAVLATQWYRATGRVLRRSTMATRRTVSAE